MTKCESCGHEFTNFWRRKACPRCGEQLGISSGGYVPAVSSSPNQDDGFDGAGFAIGMMTGVPISPTRGFSTGALIGSMLHSNPAHSSPSPSPDPAPAPSPSYDSSSSTSNESSSSSSSSYDSGSSSFDSGSSFGGDSGGTW
jgi:hypothetical protein